VNPLIAVIVGWLVGGEALTWRTVGGMVVILAGVALVRGSSRPRDVAKTHKDETGLTGYWDNPTVASETSEKI
jgi:hypothetical protein